MASNRASDGANSGDPEDMVVAEGRREDGGQIEDKASLASKTVVPGGGVFAGVGEFSSTLTPQAGGPLAQMKDLKMKYARDAMLR